MRMFSICLLWVCLWAAAPTLAQDQRLIPGEEVSGALTADALSASFAFDAQAGDIYHMVVEPLNANHSSYSLTLLTPDGTELLRASPSFNPDLQTSAYQIDADGQYRVTLEAAAPMDYLLRLVRRETPLLTYIEGTREHLSTHVDRLVYTFEGSAGDIVDLRAGSGDFDPVLSLYAPEGTLIATDDDSGGQLSALIREQTLPDSGLYRMVVHSYRPGGAGHLSVSVHEAPDQQVSPRLAYGETIDVNLTPEDRQAFWMFEGDDGDIVSITLDDPDHIARVHVETPGGWRTIASTDEYRHHTVASIERFILPESGLHEIFIESLDHTTRGSVHLRLERIGQRSLDAPDPQGRQVDQISVFMSDKSPNIDFVFDGDPQAGTSLHITQTSGSNLSLAGFRLTMTQGDTVIAAFTFDEVVAGQSLDITLHFDTPYSASIQMRLELLGEGPVWFVLSRELVYGVG